MKVEIYKYMNSGNGVLILGILWLIFWLGPALFLFTGDSRWGHNFAIPILFVIVGLAYNVDKNSCQILAAVASFMTIPTLLGFWSWYTATVVAIVFLALFFMLFVVEYKRTIELINPNKRLNFWLKKHAMTFAYLGLVHMTLIFFFVRWYNSAAFQEYLPFEHHVSTSVFNGMLVVLTVFAIIERNIKKISVFNIEKIGFSWSILMVIIPLLAIQILGQ
jgi:hypothetical protein